MHLMLYHLHRPHHHHRRSHCLRYHRLRPLLRLIHFFYFLVVLYLFHLIFYLYQRRLPFLCCPLVVHGLVWLVFHYPWTEFFLFSAELYRLLLMQVLEIQHVVVSLALQRSIFSIESRIFFNLIFGFI